MNRQNIKSLQERKKELASLKTEWKALKKQEENLKKQFYASPKNSQERAEIKNQLTRLQREKFDKGHCGTSMSIDTENEELFERLKNPTGPATDPDILASQIKDELKAILNGSRKMESGDLIGDIWEANRSREFCYFGGKKEINEMIANLARKRQEPLDLDKITTRMVRVKREDLKAADFEEIISLIRQMKDFLEQKDKQDRERKEQIKLNNPHLFTQWKCSTDGRYNGRGGWENWHTFSGKHNGFNYTIYVPDHHFALTNCLFDDGWGTNSEVGKFFVVQGAAKPTELHYWNVAQQRDEIISEAEARELTKHDKDYYINYRTYVDINDKITIDHYDEKSAKLELTPPVSGVNTGISENSDQRNIMSGGGSDGSRVIANSDNQKDDPVKFLLEYFQKNNIKQISLNSEGDLNIEYNGDQETQIAKDNLVKGYLAQIGQESLNYSQLSALLTTQNNSSRSPQNLDKLWKIGGGVIIVSAVAALGYYWYSSKNRSKKAR